MHVKAENLKHEDIAHGFFGRRGGMSNGIYKNLNCGFGTDDPIDNTNRNRGVVCESLEIELQNLLNLYQIHSDQCVVVDKPWKPEDRPQADAMVTDVPGLGLGILTADCAPVLFYGERADGTPVVGAAHAGWGGALKGVLESTVEKMMVLGVEKERLKAAIGPCIRQESYEVSNDFKAPFVAEDNRSAQFFAKAKREGHLMFDLPGYVLYRLMSAGVSEIMPIEMDTYFNEMDYFSYRRSVHRGELDYGRQISVIAIK